MKTNTIIILLILIINSCNYKSKESTNDSNGELNNRNVDFEVIAEYDNGIPKELRYYINDTILVHKCFENGLINEKQIIVKDRLVEYELIDSSGITRKHEISVINDSIDDLVMLHEFNEDGMLTDCGLKRNDSIYIGEWKVILDSNNYVVYNLNFEGVFNDTAFVYLNDNLVAYKIKQTKGWIDIKIKN